MDQTESDLVAVADYLWEKKEVILNKWKKRAQKNERQSSSLLVLSQKKFYNNIPEFLHNLTRVLKQEENEIEKISQIHGSQRWQLNFDLRELIEEWSLLHTILIEEVNLSPQSLDISSESLSTAHKEIAETVYKGIKLSLNEFYRMHRMEAQAQITDLERMLQEHDEQNKLQGYNLRQASHDLGGSVALIQVNLHLLKKKQLSGEAGELVDQLSGSAEILLKLFKSLLDLFRLEAGDEEITVTDFDAAELLGKVCENMQSMAAKNNLKLYTKGVDSLPVRGDWIKIRRIAQNLVMNALKYTDEGYVEIGWGSHNGNHWMMTIKDTGPGLDTSAAALFDRSGGIELPAQDKAPHMKENQHPGEGIGLSIVRRLCELLDSVVEVETAHQRGTLFKLIFPADYPEEKNPEERQTI